MSKFIPRVAGSFCDPLMYRRPSRRRRPTGTRRTSECLESTSRADHSRKTCNGNDQTTSRPNGSPNKDKSTSAPSSIPLEMAIESLKRETSGLSMTTSARLQVPKYDEFLRQSVDENINRKFRTAVISCLTL